MSWSGRVMRNVLLPVANAFIGRRNLVRLGRLISMEARLDSANDMAHNGERMLQQHLLRHAYARKLVVFDIGANKGEWTQSLFDQAGSAQVEVHLFEPASATYAQLKKNLAPLGNKVVVVNQALSDKPGTAEFVIIGSGLGTNSLQADRSKAQAIEKVQLNTVYDYCRKAGITQIDLMKVDAEGHDISVLEGARGMFTSRSIAMVQFEYNQLWIGSRHLLKDAFDLLLPLGYKLGKVTPTGIEFYPAWHFELESYREGNYLACTAEWAERLPKVRWWNLD